MAAGQTGYNGFVSANLQAVTVDEGFVATVDYSAYSGGYPFSISGDIRSVPS